MTDNEVTPGPADGQQLMISPQAAEETDLRLTRQAEDVDSIRVLAYLLVGGAILASDDLQNRLKQMRTQLGQIQMQRGAIVQPEDDRERLRYALIGLMLQTPNSVQKGLSILGRAANTAFGLFSSVVRPVSNSRLLRPAQARYESLVERGEHIVNGWVQAGRSGETVSRDVVQEITDDVVDDLVELLADRPEIRELVQQQSIGLAQEFSGELQSRSAAADSLLERITYKLLPFARRDITPTLVVPDLKDDER